MNCDKARPTYCFVIKVHVHVTDGSFVAQRESRFRLHCDNLSPESLTVPKGKETLGNLLSRLEEDKLSESWVGHVTFFVLFFTGHPGLLRD